MQVARERRDRNTEASAKDDPFCDTVLNKHSHIHMPSVAITYSVPVGKSIVSFMRATIQTLERKSTLWKTNFELTFLVNNL